MLLAGAAFGISGSLTVSLGLSTVRMKAFVSLHCTRRGLGKNIVSNTAPERGVLSVLSLGVALRTGLSGVSKAAETCVFLASI